MHRKRPCLRHMFETFRGHKGASRCGRIRDAGKSEKPHCFPSRRARDAPLCWRGAASGARSRKRAEHLPCLARDEGRHPQRTPLSRSQRPDITGGAGCERLRCERDEGAGRDAARDTPGDYAYHKHVHVRTRPALRWHWRRSGRHASTALRTSHFCYAAPTLSITKNISKLIEYSNRKHTQNKQFKLKKWSNIQIHTHINDN